MKRKILALVPALLLFTSCSEDETVEVNSNSSSLLLERIETYTPLQQNYDTKKVAYYQNQQFVADTLFDNQNTIISTSARSVNGNNVTISQYDASNTFLSSVEYSYDGNNRLTEVVNTNNLATDTKVITYNADNTVTVYYEDDNNQLLPYIVYAKNAEGLITSSNIIDSQENSTIAFNNTIPIQLNGTDTFGQDIVYTNFTYFTTPVPSNEHKSITELNNIILSQDQLSKIADYHIFHLKSYEDIFRYEKEFNSFNYLIYSKFISETTDITNESFYYYN